MKVFITVDTEVWPVHSGGWPRKPLPSSRTCKREIDAYFFGNTGAGSFGLPYQLRMLERHGLVATYFVDPMFSFALGIDVLRAVVQLIEGAGQRIALHLHPEWLTDHRCLGLPEFRGPNMSQYSADDQAVLIRAGMRRLRDAGANPLPVFRAGSWGGDVSTLEALRMEQIRIDCSLNAHVEQSMPSLRESRHFQEPFEVEGVLEYPLTMLDDRVARRGRPLSMVGLTWSELRFALNACETGGRRNVVVVLHSNEFVRTERLWKNEPIVQRRMVTRRFERFCRYLERNRHRFDTRHVGTDAAGEDLHEGGGTLPRSNIVRTAVRLGSQVLSRWL